MTETTDWTRWRGSWQTRGPTPEELTSAVARFRRAKRRAGILLAIEWAIVGLAVVFPVMAMRHAANAAEAALGIGAIVIVLGVAGFRAWNHRAERHALGTSGRDFENAMRFQRQAELRFVRFLWLVLGVEGVFAAAWWYGGMKVHHSPLSAIAVGMLWLPLLIVAITLGWSIRLRNTATREISASSLQTRTPGDTDTETMI